MTSPSDTAKRSKSGEYRLTLDAWRALTCLLADPAPNHCPCTAETDAELEREGLIECKPFRVTTDGLLAYGKLHYAMQHVA